VRGLCQAFHLAGARSVLATLWSIPDLETSQLVETFFRCLAAGDDKAEALRKAQVSVIGTRRRAGKSPDPVYWAAFTLSGRWQTVRADQWAERIAPPAEPDEDRNIASEEATRPSSVINDMRHDHRRLTYALTDEQGSPRHLVRSSTWRPDGQPDKVSFFCMAEYAVGTPTEKCIRTKTTTSARSFGAALGMRKAACSVVIGSIAISICRSESR
jgi:hypothetical protein